jgi:hypothetical protein
MMITSMPITDTHLTEPDDLWTSRMSSRRWGNLIPSEAIGPARKIAAGAPLAVPARKRLLRGSDAAKVAAVLRSEGAAEQDLMKTQDFVKGASMLRASRAPEFKGL